MPCVEGKLSRFGVFLLVIAACPFLGCAKMKGNRREEPRLGSLDDAEPRTSLAQSKNKTGMQSAAVSAIPDPRVPKVSLESRLDNPRNRPTEGTTIVTTRPAPPTNSIKLGSPIPLDLPEVHVQPPESGSLVAVKEISVGKPRELKVAPVAAPTVTPESLVKAARMKVNSLNSYKVAMNRQERLGDNLPAAEDVILSVRREPKSVRLEWPTGPTKGREVIFTAADGQLHVHTPGALIPRVDISPDNPLVARNSRHPITEAGFDTIVANLEASLTGPVEARMKYEGKETPEGFAKACHKLTKGTPEGGKWLVYLDNETKLPALVQEVGPGGELQEKYIFKDVEANPAELLAANAFDPDARWGKSAVGMLSRLARGAGPANPATSEATTPR